MAAIVEIGPNLNTVLLALIVAIPAIIAAVRGKQAKASADAGTAAAQEAAAQLKNNGGSTALDKMQAGQREIMERLDGIERTQREHGRRLAGIEAKPPASSG